MNYHNQVPILSRVNKSLIILYVGVFLVHSILFVTTKQSLLHHMGLNPSAFFEGHIYQLITFPFIDTKLISVVFNALLLWFIGSELEHKWGIRFYLKFLCISTYASGVVFVLLTAISDQYIPLFHGMTGTNLALLIAYGMVYSERLLLFMFVIPMRAKYFCLLLAGIEIFMAFTERISSLVHCVAMGVAFFYLRYASFVARGGSLKALKNQRNKQKMRGKLRLVKDEEDEKHNPDEPKYWQ